MMDDDTASEGDLPPSRQQRVLSKVFSAGEGPLDQCMTWVAAQDRSFVVLAHETPAEWSRPGEPIKITRRYEALDAGQGLAMWASTPMPVRHAHEVICPGPVHLYADIDVDASDPVRSKANLFCQTLVAELCAAAARQFAVTCDIVQLDSSQAKFSRHLIGHMRNAVTGRPVAFASAADCGAFVASVQQNIGLGACLAGGTRSLCDMAVYRRRGTLRLYGSSKYGEKRWLRVWQDGASLPLPTDGRLPLATLRQTLISVPAGTVDQLLDVVGGGDATPNTNKVPARTPTLSCRSPAAAADLLAAVQVELPSVADAGVHDVGLMDSGMIRLKCQSRVCERKGGDHRSNTIYFLLDGRRRRFRQFCWSPSCVSRPATPWRPLPAGVAAAVAAITDPGSGPGAGLRPTTYGGGNGIETTVQWPG